MERPYGAVSLARSLGGSEFLPLRRLLHALRYCFELFWLIGTTRRLIHVDHPSSRAIALDRLLLVACFAPTSPCLQPEHGHCGIAPGNGQLEEPAQHLSFCFEWTLPELLRKVLTQCRRGIQIQQSSNLLVLHTVTGQRLHPAALLLSGLKLMQRHRAPPPFFLCLEAPE